MDWGRRAFVACLALVALTASASALTLSSVKDGDWGDPATWGQTGPAQPGVNVPTSSDHAYLYHTVTAGAGVSYSSGHKALRFYPGGQLIVDGGSVYCSRADFLGNAPALTVNSGYLGFGRVDSGNGASVQINGGLYDFPTTLGILPVTISGGTARGRAYPITLDGGKWDANFTQNLYLGAGGLVWNAGTVANPGQAHDYTIIQVANLGANASRIVDINDQQVLPGAAQTWNLKSAARNVYGTLVGTAGTVQFDIYSAFVNDCDSIINAANNSSLGSGVIFDIGYAGGEISDPTAFLGQDYRLLTLLSGTDYSALLASVPDAVWFDGVREWLVSFSNNVATDGSIRIASIAPMQTAIPEPLTALAVLLGAGGLGRYLRRRQ